MTIKERLKELKHLGLLLESLQEQHKKDKELYDLFPGQAERWAAGSFETIEETKKRQQATLDLIQSLADPLQREVLLLRYYEGLKWKELPERLNFSLQTLYKIHRVALKELERVGREQERPQTISEIREGVD